MSEVKNIPEGWIKTTIGEVVTLSQGVAINAKTNHVLSNELDGIPLLKINNLINGTIDQYADPKKVPVQSILGLKDVVFTRTGQVGEVFTNKYGILHNNSFKVTPNKDIYWKFLFWFLKNKSVYNFVQKIASGSVQLDLNHGAFKIIPMLIPPLEEQRAIANILTSLDDKIALLQAQNKTLEATAQTVFKEWFGKYQVGDELPEGWREGKVSELIDIIGGGTPKTSIDEYWNGDICWFSVVDAPNETDCFCINTEKRITRLGLEKSSTKLLRVGTTIISARGTVGKLAIVGEKMAMNQSCYGIQGKEGVGDYFVYFQLKEGLSQIKNNVHGAVFDTITKNTFDSIEIPIATLSKILTFEKRVTPLMRKILNNVKQVQTLANTRDTLLPKLMSGEVRV